MRIIDSLLIAPALFLVIGVLVGLFTEVDQSRLWATVAAASLASLTLHWLAGRAAKRKPTPEPYSQEASPRGPT
jgi:hypothetical protein